MPAAATCIPKPTLGKQLLERAFAAGVRAAWVKPDSIYGGDTKPRRYLEEREQPFVLCFTSGATVTCPTRSVAIRCDPSRFLLARRFARRDGGDGFPIGRQRRWAARSRAHSIRGWLRRGIVRRPLVIPAGGQATSAQPKQRQVARIAAEAEVA